MIWDNFQRYAFYDDLKDLYTKTMPELNRYEERIIEFNLELEKLQIILRRFDEIMSEKSSKIDLQKLERTLTLYMKNSEYQDHTKALNEKIQRSIDRNKELEDMIDSMGRNISKDIYNAVRKATSHLVKTNKAGSPGGEQEATVLSEELKFVLLGKAEKFEVENLSHIKANKCDTELCFKWIDLVHKQLKQTLVLIIENLKFQVEGENGKTGLLAAGEGANMSQNGKVFLFQQALLIGQWVNKFNIKNVDEYFEDISSKIPTEIVAFQKYTEQSLKEVDQMKLSPNN